MQLLVKNYPSFIYDMGNFEFGEKLGQNQRKQGVYCKITTPQFLEGAKCKNNLTMLFSSSSYPKNIYNMPLFEVGVEIQFKFEFKFKLELKHKRNYKRKGKKTV